jgi:hypothetical protein
MAYDHYGQFGDDADRSARDRDYDRNRGQNRGRDEDRGFFERAGEEIKSWFSDDEDRDRNDRDRTRAYDNRSERDRSYRSQSNYDRDPNVNRYGERGAHNMGRGYEPERGRSWSDRSSNWDDRWSREPGRSQSYGSSDRYSSADRGNEYGSQSGRYGTQGQYGSRSGQYDSRYGSNSRDDDDSGVLIYEEISGTLGGFGNQRFASSQDDHYRNWRDRQIAQLDRDYQEYCRECEQNFHRDFDSWRSQRKGQQSQSEMASSGSSSPASSSASPSQGSQSAIGSDQSKSTTASSSSNKQLETASSGSSRSGSNRSTS